MRAFLLTVVVVDDVVSLAVIATVYSGHVALGPLLIALAIVGVLLLVRASRIRHGLIYALLGAAAWGAVLFSGVDPVTVGLVMGLLTYAYPPAREDLERATGLFRLFREQPTPELARSASTGLTAALSPNERLVQLYHPWTSYLIVPMFALANAGIAISALVTMVEYGDFECPYCGQAEPVIRELLADYGDVRYVWRHLPLSDVHPRAQLAAEATEAAASQDAFWPMHDLLLDHQGDLRPADLSRYATNLGLDVERFRNDLREHTHAPRIAEDVDSAGLSGVSGTPTFFINGRRHYGAYDLTTLTSAVKTAKARAAITAQPDSVPHGRPGPVDSRSTFVDEMPSVSHS